MGKMWMSHTSSIASNRPLKTSILLIYSSNLSVTYSSIFELYCVHYYYIVVTYLVYY